ncbi:MAG: cupin domain-containing protein [Rhodospirillaceae bacterium]|nr:cupin domain-containing protein [Rhodospirillaceae bacterium]
MKISILRKAEALADSELEDWGPVGLPQGEPVSRLSGKIIEMSADEDIESGVWQCTPGRWRRQVKKAEFCHFLKGRCSFTPDDGGATIEIATGDSLFFPPFSEGIWDVKETVRKVFIVFEWEA